MISHTHLDTSRPVIKNWSFLLVPGLLYMFVGLMVFIIPSGKLLLLTTLYGLSFLVSALSELVFFYRNRTNKVIWEGRLVGASLDILMAVLLISLPGLMLPFLPLYIAIWLLFRGIAAIWFSLRSRLFRNLDGLRLLIFELAIVNFLFLFLADSINNELHLRYITGLAFFAAGAYRLFLVYDMKMIHGFVSKNLHNMLGQK